MSHPFGDLLSQHLHRKHGLSQARLAAGILQDPAVITQMCQGRRLTGRQARERVVAVISWLHDQGVLGTTTEADALLLVAGMAPLNDTVGAEQALRRLLVHPERPPTFVAEAAGPRPRGHDLQLPAAVGPLIGRQQELMEVVQCLVGGACRLLNLVGPGGIGKTRLAIAAAHALGDHFVHGVCWANLQPIQDPAGLATALADALNLPLAGRGTEAAQLVHYLHSRQMLLVLDNFEQLAAAADLLVEIVARAPRVTLLVTSREAIHIQAEWLYPIGSLAFPAGDGPRGGDLAWEEIASYAAVQLFVTRARQLQPAFAPEAQSEAIARICRLTGGMPLALVLAAAWIPSLTCVEIADELAADLAVLSTKLRDLPERHRTLHAVFEQSWLRLGPEEQAVFGRLVLFRGGFRREAAQQVAGATLPLLAALVDHSFLVQGEDGRYQIHELLCQLGEAKLAADPHELAATRARHCAYYADLLSRKAPEMLIGDDVGAVGELAPEMANIRAAWQWAIEYHDAAALHKSAVTLYWICQVKCRFQEGFQLMRAATATLQEYADDDSVVAAQIECSLYVGFLALRLGYIDEATQAASLSLLLQRTSGIAPVPGWGNTALGLLSLLAMVRGDPAGAEKLARDGYQADTDSGNVKGLITDTYALAQACLAQGKYDAAVEAIDESAAICRRYQVTWFLAYCLVTQGEIAFAQRRLDTARQNFEDALAIRRKFGDPEGIALALNHLGAVALQEGKLDEAAAHFAAGLAQYADTNDMGGLATAEEGLGQVAFRRGECPRAAQRYRQALQLAAAGSYVPRIMSLLNHTAELLLYGDDREQANQLLMFVLESASSSQVSKGESRRLLALGAVPVETNERHALLTLDGALALAEAALSHT